MIVTDPNKLLYLYNKTVNCETKNFSKQKNPVEVLGFRRPTVTQRDFSFIMRFAGLKISYKLVTVMMCYSDFDIVVRAKSMEKTVKIKKIHRPEWQNK